MAMMAGFGINGLIRASDAAPVWWLFNPLLWAVSGLIVAALISATFEKVFVR